MNRFRTSRNMKLDFVAGVAPLLLEQFRRLPGIGATMTHPTHPLQPRREFLKTAALASTGLLSSSFSSEAQPGVRLCRLLPGCCAYSYGSYLAKGTMTMEDFIVKAVELGVSGVDITTYWLKSTDPAYLVSLRSFAYRHGMPFSSLAIGADLCQPDSTKRAETLQTVFKWIDATQLLVPHTCGYLATNCRPARLPSKASEGWRKR
jgi:hypothetical protein